MDNLKISVEVMKKKGSVVARAAVQLPILDSTGSVEATVTIGGFQIMRNKYAPPAYKVTAPSFSTEGGYKPIAFTSPVEKWRELEEQIIGAYLKTVDPFKVTQ